MITVAEAEKRVLAQLRDYGAQTLPFEQALGYTLAEDLKADRDLPPFNRVTMDGIALKYSAVENGIGVFRIKATQAAGDEPVDLEQEDECIEIMTGAVLPSSADSVVRYEDIQIAEGWASIRSTEIKKGQNLHLRGVDKKAGDIVAKARVEVSPTIVSVAASIGKSQLLVKKMPRVMIISSGDELVDVHETPSPYQIRKSNSYTVKAVLKQHNIEAEILHIPDNPDITKQQIKYCLQNYDVLLLSGGISMGKFDYVPQALQELGVEKLFHKVAQRPGKPFWFGKYGNDGPLVFAFPGNPVATFMCLHRYFLTWLNATLGMPASKINYAALGKDFTFKPELQYYLQVTLHSNEQAQLIAMPVEGNGSGDFANLAGTEAFLELPMDRSEFKEGEVFRIWDFTD